MEQETIEEHFNNLSDITDRLAMMNSHYDTDIEAAIQDMESIVEEAMSWDPADMLPEIRKVYLSHMSFHREIVGQTITDARELLIQERRQYLKQLVAYHKNFSSWFLKIEKKYAAA